MANDKADVTSKAGGAAAKPGGAAATPAPVPADPGGARLKLRYQDIPDLPETFADSIGQWIFDGQALRIEFTVTRLDASGSSPPSTGRRVPAARIVLTPGCALELIRHSQQLLAALEKAPAAQQPPPARNPSTPSGRT